MPRQAAESYLGIIQVFLCFLLLSTFREGTIFIIKTVSFMSGGPYGPGGVLSDFFFFGGGVPKVYSRREPTSIVAVESK